MVLGDTGVVRHEDFDGAVEGLVLGDAGSMRRDTLLYYW